MFELARTAELSLAQEIEARRLQVAAEVEALVRCIDWAQPHWVNLLAKQAAQKAPFPANVLGRQWTMAALLP